MDAVKSNIAAAKAVARVLRSSLGPKGMDKMLQSPDGDVTISECFVLGGGVLGERGLREKKGRAPTP